MRRTPSWIPWVLAALLLGSLGPVTATSALAQSAEVAPGDDPEARAAGDEPSGDEGLPDQDLPDQDLPGGDLPDQDLPDADVPTGGDL